MFCTVFKLYYSAEHIVFGSQTCQYFPNSHILFLSLFLTSCIYVDRQVVASNSIQILDMGKTLRLLKATTADAGSYSCKAINIAGSTEKDFFLDVLGE